MENIRLDEKSHEIGLAIKCIKQSLDEKGKNSTGQFLADLLGHWTRFLKYKVELNLDEIELVITIALVLTDSDTSSKVIAGMKESLIEKGEFYCNVN